MNDCSSFPPSHTELYLSEFNGSCHEAKVINAFSGIRSWARSEPPVCRGEDTLRVDLATFLRSDYYNLLWRAAGIHQQLILHVRDAVRSHGMMYVYRAPNDPPFEVRDIKMLELIAKFVAHGMMPARTDNDAFNETEDRALLTVTNDGAIQHATEHAQRLMMQALSSGSLTTIRWCRLGESASEIESLCQALAATATGQFGQPPPARRIRNVWGEFVLRAYWLGPTDGVEQTRHIGITIERRVPRSLALLRRVEDLPLTAREKQLCLLLVGDPARHDFADAMGLASSTVVTHQRSIYAKLGVHSRAGLIAALQPA